MNAYPNFQRFTPVAKAGYSIFIYHLTQADIDQARRAPTVSPFPGDRKTPP